MDKEEKEYRDEHLRRLDEIDESIEDNSKSIFLGSIMISVALLFNTCSRSTSAFGQDYSRPGIYEGRTTDKSHYFPRNLPQRTLETVD